MNMENLMNEDVTIPDELTRSITGSRLLIRLAMSILINARSPFLWLDNNDNGNTSTLCMTEDGFNLIDKSSRE